MKLNVGDEIKVVKEHFLKVKWSYSTPEVEVIHMIGKKGKKIFVVITIIASLA